MFVTIDIFKYGHEKKITINTSLIVAIEPKGEDLDDEPTEKDCCYIMMASGDEYTVIGSLEEVTARITELETRYELRIRGGYPAL